MLAALEGKQAQQIFIEATDGIIEAVKRKTVKLT